MGKKHQISKEMFPFSLFTPPLRNGRLLGYIGARMRPPRKFLHHKMLNTRTERIPGYGGEDIEILIAEPRGLASDAPCLVYYHGGGFIFGASWHHYNMAAAYALRTPCKLAIVQYRLAPKHPFPTPPEDCYAALRWIFENAETLGIDKNRIAAGGDSAGGALTAAVCQMARDRGTALPRFQFLIYPVTDRRMQTESQRIFTDTPMWNAKLSERMWRAYVQTDHGDIAYASPMEAATFENLPDAYVETAEFDCLRDEGVAYAEALHGAGASVFLNETKGTMHGFDVAKGAAVTQAAVAERIRFLQRGFYGK